LNSRPLIGGWKLKVGDWEKPNPKTYNIVSILAVRNPLGKEGVLLPITIIN